jgi:hypothetical protein
MAGDHHQEDDDCFGVSKAHAIQDALPETEEE